MIVGVDQSGLYNAIEPSTPIGIRVTQLQAAAGMIFERGCFWKWFNEISENIEVFGVDTSDNCMELVKIFGEEKLIYLLDVLHVLILQTLWYIVIFIKTNRGYKIYIDGIYLNYLDITKTKSTYIIKWFNKRSENIELFFDKCMEFVNIFGQKNWSIC